MNVPDDLINARYASNISRVNGLVKFVWENDAVRPALAFQDSVGIRADILRSVVVFLYATFEDALRSVARQNLPNAEPARLTEIPFVGGDEKKLTLSQLAAHRTKSVAQLVDESVQYHLNRKSFSTFEDVVKVLDRLGVETKPFAYFAKPLGQMMRRRHRIVHEGDLPGPQESASQAWTVTDDWQLLMWLLSVEAFYCLLRARLDAPNPTWQPRHDRLTKAIDCVVAYGNRLLDFAKSDAATRTELFQKLVTSLDSIKGVLESPLETSPGAARGPTGRIAPHCHSTE